MKEYENSLNKMIAISIVLGVIDHLELAIKNAEKRGVCFGVEKQTIRKLKKGIKNKHESVIKELYGF